MKNHNIYYTKLLKLYIQYKIQKPCIYITFMINQDLYKMEDCKALILKEIPWLSQEPNFFNQFLDNLFYYDNALVLVDSLDEYINKVNNTSEDHFYVALYDQNGDCITENT